METGQPTSLLSCHGILVRFKKTTFHGIFLCAPCRCAKVITVLIFCVKIFVSRLAGLSSHPVVHLTLGLLFQKLNRWEILQNQTLSSMPDSPQARSPGDRGGGGHGGFSLGQEGVGCFEDQGGAPPDLAWR